MSTSDLPIFPIAYFPPVHWFAAALKYDRIVLEISQFYRKQQYTSRAHVRLPNQVYPLTIPVERRGARVPIADKKITFTESWQQQHWRSLVTAYRNSPYFEYYEDRLQPLFEREFERLIDLHVAILDLVFPWLSHQPELLLSQSFQPSEAYSKDFRGDFDPARKKFPDWFVEVPYPQVFGEFEVGLSILDLLFNEGPNSRSILLNSWKES
ncbi:WbqC family protein [Pontibacter sp. G13]|uniref:WbqC family protein n=1 Tax=Pontibacter sp. G13 TaxID=3074898 RepID=UPI00288BB3DA|nr:WbqC family protein [Pontibacter sp. G13]WNJ18504.1 WbqC family protein [Pontibacter sp. G13]